MNDLISKKTKKRTKKIVKPIGEELEKVKISAKKQVTGKDQAGNSVIVEAMQQKSESGDLTSDEKKKRDDEMIKRSKELEDQILIERKKRIERYKEWERGQEQEEVVSEPGKPLEVPDSKPAKGAPGAGSGKQKSPEVRKSKH